MKIAISDDVGQVKVITSTPGVNTTVKPTPTSIQPKIRSYLKPDIKDAVVDLCVVESWRDGTTDAIAIATARGEIKVLHPRTGKEIFKFSANETTRFKSISYNRELSLIVAGTSTAEGFFISTLSDSDNSSTNGVSSYKFPVAGASIKEAEFEVMRAHDTLKGPAIADTHAPGAVAFAGNERELEIWVSKSAKAESQEVTWERNFIAKNIKNDELNRRVPVHITDLRFLPTKDSDNVFKVAVVSKHSYIRIYHTATSRRPILNIPNSIPSPIHSLNVSPITPVSLPGTDDMLPNIVISAGNGDVLLYSLSERRPIGKYRTDSTGIVSRTNISEIKNSDAGDDDESTWVLSAVGADRYLRVWNLKTRKLITRVWAKTRGTGVGLLASSSNLEDPDLLPSGANETRMVTNGKPKLLTAGEHCSDDSGEEEGDDADDADMWDDMEQVSDNADDENSDEMHDTEDEEQQQQQHQQDSDDSIDEEESADDIETVRVISKSNKNKKRLDTFSTSKPKRRKT